MADNELTPPSQSALAAADKFEDPGLPAHGPRRADVDAKAERAAYRTVVLLLFVSIASAIAGVVGFFLFPAGVSLLGIRLGHTMLGVGLGLAMLCIGLAAVHWAKVLMNDSEIVEERHVQESDAATRQGAVAVLKQGAEDANIARRPLLKGALVTAAALAPLPVVVPLVGGLTKSWDYSPFAHTAWRNVPAGHKGRRLATDPDNRLIKASEVTNDSIFHIVPHDLGKLPGEEEFLNEKAKAIVLLVRIDPRELKVSPGKEDWNYHGIIAFSKVCTHVGCPVALYERNTKHLLCPCHQSTFDLADEAKVIFGPAKRPLPQLPIAVDEEGYLYAKADFNEPVGPSYWEREK